MAQFAYNNAGAVYNDGAGGGLPGTTISDQALKNSYKRDSQFDYKVKQIGAIADAYRNPGEYFDAKGRALAAASDQAAVVYKDEFQKLTKGLIPAATAHARAKKLADTYAALLMADVETDFPSNLNDLSLQLHYQTSATNAANGFIAPSTATGASPVGKRRRKHRK